MFLLLLLDLQPDICWLLKGAICPILCKWEQVWGPIQIPGATVALQSHRLLW